MRIHITALLPAIGFCGRLPALDLETEPLSQNALPRQNEAPPLPETGGLDVYKVAVMFLVGASILSLF
jgi:hypothetical protein